MDADHREAPQRLLQWVQQAAGVSRRTARGLIEAGEVAVDGGTVIDPFLAVDADRIDRLSLRGHPLSLRRPELRAYRYHKPAGVLCSHDDPHYGNTVGRILRAEGFIGYTWAGRLDQDAEGLILLTNDGDLVHRLSHPRYEVPKRYRVWLERLPPKGQMDRILREMGDGIDDAGETLRIAAGRVEGRPPAVALTLTEGKKHEIKRLFAHFDLSVRRLQRIVVGPVALGDLAPGAFARLSADELARLRAVAGLGGD